MSTRFFTNDNSNTLLKKFEGIFEHNPDLARFDALVGYLRASGYFAIRPKLVNVPVFWGSGASSQHFCFGGQVLHRNISAGGYLEQA
jgi:hypothetical protein